MIVLIINKDANWLRRQKSGFETETEVLTAECHSFQEAMEAIAKYKPSVVFIEHALTENGHEGLDVADHVSGKTVYITTEENSVAPTHLRHGVRVISKIDLSNTVAALIEGDQLAHST